MISIRREPDWEGRIRFIAVDVETANPDPGSICQIGLVEFSDGKQVDQWKTLVDPEDYFDSFNTSLHGIDAHAVEGAPSYPELAYQLQTSLEEKITVCHTAFDRVALERAHNRYRLPPLACTWLDSARVVRRTWDEFSHSGYGLSNVACKLGISFTHHDAAEDARAAGLIMLHAIEHTGLSIEEWLDRVEKPLHSDRQSVARESTGDGPLADEVFCFTGALSITRHEAADLVAGLGAAVRPSVTKKTTVLVVGDQDTRRLAGYSKSSKHRKAESLAREGQPIRIISEEGFLRVSQTQDTC